MEMAMATPSSFKDGGGASKSVVRSGLLVEKKSFTWIIDNFEIINKSDKLISSQKFQFEAGSSIGLPTSSWEFRLEPREVGEEEPKEKWISIFLQLLKIPRDVEQVAFRVKCKRADGTTYFKANEPFKEMDNTKSWGWAKFVQRDATVKALPLVDGSLIVELEFTLYAAKPHTLDLDVPTQLKAFETESIQQLSKDLGQVNSLTDGGPGGLVKIISKDKVEFPVNRVVLSARSLVFQRMLLSGMKESETGLVQIDDLSGKTLSVLLHYIMTGKLHEDWNSAEVITELPYAAHKYELGMLVDFLGSVLGNVCTIGNARQLFILAKRLGMKKAEVDLLAFIKKTTAGVKSLEDLTMLMDTTDP